MHFATFAGSDIEAFDPIVKLTNAKDENQVGNWEEEGGFGVIDVGETATVPICLSSDL
jgi:N-acyl-phosphatidylethanolamine-hydrolysing phospholipase D